MKLLAIGAGHGGSDPGAIANGYVEKELNMIVARRVYTLLKARGIVDIDLIRKSDYTLIPSERTKLIKNKYKYCISIHFNRFNRKAHGVETIHSIYGEEGKKLAEIIANKLEGYINVPTRRVFSREGSRGDYYYMHRDTGSTTVVIVEGMFIDSESDIDSLNIEKISEAIADGFMEFIEWMKPKKTEFKHYKISQTDIVELDPMDLKISIQDKQGTKITLDNFITSGYQWHYNNGATYPLGILVSKGKIISNTQPHAFEPNKPLSAGTFIVYKDGSVDVKAINDITKEKDVWFAVSGCSILPKIRMNEEGFINQFSDIGRTTLRPVIGWNPNKKKAVLAMRPLSSITRGQRTLMNLGCSKGITLDAGGSSILKVNDKFIYKTSRRLYSVITW